MKRGKTKLVIHHPQDKINKDFSPNILNESSEIKKIKNYGNKINHIYTVNYKFKTNKICSY